MTKGVSVAEIQRHDRPDDAWIVVNDQVYDVSDFAPEHPGGAEVIYRYAGRDASAEYNEVHGPSLISKSLDTQYHMGGLDRSTITNEWREPDRSANTEPDVASIRPPLDNIISLYDFQDVAKTTLTKKAWAYISGASNDNITRDANGALLKRIWLRPFVMRNVGTVNTKTQLFGCALDLPIYISPTGAVKTAGPEGEMALAKAAGESGIIQCISTPASFPHQEILDATPHHAFFQLYVNKDRAKSEAALRQVARSGKVKAIFVTADLPVVSKREADERVRAESPVVNVNVNLTTRSKDKKGAGLARQTGSFIDPTLNWEDIAWIRSITDLPIVVKGIQRWGDALLALQHGCQGIVLSNHGGRAADTAMPAIITLLELHKNCPQVFGSMEILIDGGFRRGSDVVKAICLGASAVGLGRPFMYAVNYGQEGVEHAVQILQDEVETAMRLCGLTDLMRDAKPDLVNTADIDHLVVQGGHPYARSIIRGPKL
ncbi:hypothetical protein ACJ41O_007335 [Fusarium nematophilum]